MGDAEQSFKGPKGPEAIIAVNLAFPKRYAPPILSSALWLPASLFYGGIA